ncbi:MAG: DUF2790 domain-containing protein [Pseudomonas sp.]|nr:DUF2790 domain-containing protein [Pseudomonas sp.]
MSDAGPLPNYRCGASGTGVIARPSGLRVISHHGVLHMNIRRFSLAGLLAVIILGSASLLADEGTETPAYTYDTKLDIARVIRIEEPQSQTCEVVQATMTYVNTQGLTKTLSFLKLADVCISNG